MATEPRWGDKLPSDEKYTRTTTFAGELPNVTGARLAAEEFLLALTRASPPAAPEHWDDILLVVTELAANVVQYAPGPFELCLRRTFDGVHVAMHDTSTTPPAPRPFHPGRGGGGVGWHLIHTLCDQVSVVVTDEGKDIHVFMPW
ncbi:ATP-binding protein [Streptomyces sp. NPDC002701]|jgi:anti-sigma regulatory factor (Ser/Thr protein kinase)|uniref:ATP-binding protein n=1 Tax=unclassified Streptomyces TaxID=2593676 RepID=UPI0036ADD186